MSPRLLTSLVLVFAVMASGCTTLTTWIPVSERAQVDSDLERHRIGEPLRYHTGETDLMWHAEKLAMEQERQQFEQEIKRIAEERKQSDTEGLFW